MAVVIERARAADAPPEAGRYDAPAMVLLVKLCRELQRVAGPDPFYLAVRVAGEHIGLDHRTSWRRLKVLLADGVIELVEQGTRGRAATYRYTGPQSPQDRP